MTKEEYKKETLERFKELPVEYQKSFSEDECTIQERIMRLGAEAKIFNLSLDEYREFAILSLKRDIIHALNVV